jgi:hypothetical protein
MGATAMHRVAFIPLLAACMVATVIGQSPYSQLTLLVDAATYLSPAYAAERGSPHAFLFYQHEPITARIRIFNGGDVRATLVPLATEARRLFVIEITRDGVPFPVLVEFANGVSRFHSQGQYPYSLDQSLEFERQEGLEWHLTVTEPSLPAGFYALTVRPRATDGDSRLIRPRAPTFHFEVRTPTDEDRPELLQRTADRHLRLGAYDDARATIEELIRIHPRSVIAQMLRQQLAIAQGNRSELVAAIEQARTLLAAGQDALLLKFRTPEQLREVLLNLPVIKESGR